MTHDRVHVLLPAPIRKALDQLAEQRGYVSRSDIIREAVREHLQRATAGGADRLAELERIASNTRKETR